ncbi:hypothetical protein SELMODRAFT_423074 [Selaginella moellendorffii]|uniref:Uncharacterized protein n=1 Tax=Selaginella moellendorffii TaxID=88036 RepID=D8SKH2_SELML|nr:hypothetical protein SELMODRAFT_423074 [Selaginella moellendorffii]
MAAGGGDLIQQSLCPSFSNRLIQRMRALTDLYSKAYIKQRCAFLLEKTSSFLAFAKAEKELVSRLLHLACLGSIALYREGQAPAGKCWSDLRALPFGALCRAGCFVWGKGDGGRLGIDTEFNQYKPYVNIRIKRVQMASAGGLHNIALTEVGNVYTWGHGAVDALGHGSYERELIVGRPVERQDSSRELYTWGRDEGEGRLGHGNPDIMDEGALSRPTKVQALDVPIASVYCGGFFTMALTKSGQLWSWGEDGKVIAWGYGGNGQEKNRLRPQPLPSILQEKDLRPELPWSATPIPQRVEQDQEILRLVGDARQHRRLHQVLDADWNAVQLPANGLSVLVRESNVNVGTGCWGSSTSPKLCVPSDVGLAVGLFGLCEGSLRGNGTRTGGIGPYKPLVEKLIWQRPRYLLLLPVTSLSAGKPPGSSHPIPKPRRSSFEELREYPQSLHPSYAAHCPKLGDPSRQELRRPLLRRGYCLLLVLCHYRWAGKYRAAPETTSFAPAVESLE